MEEGSIEYGIFLQAQVFIKNSLIPDSMGFRSPQGNYAGGGGGFMTPGSSRSLRESEEQMASLKKENFNLKLRIYFIEEKHASNITDEETYKQNIELKVSVFVLTLHLMRLSP